jgi:hypothetical protein
LAKIEQEVAEKTVGKEARNKQQYLGTLKGVALDNLQKEQFDAAMDKVEEAKQIIAELNQVFALALSRVCRPFFHLIIQRHHTTKLQQL